MDKTRRALLLTLPAGMLWGLTGCQGSSPDDSWEIDNVAEGSGILVASSDGVFSGTLAQSRFTPDSNLIQACLNKTMLFIQLWQGLDNQQRSITLRLPVVEQDYVDGLVFDLAAVPQGDAIASVLATSFNAADGYGEHALHEFELRSGTLRVDGLSTLAETIDGFLTLTFTDVQGTPTALTASPANVGSGSLRLDGSVENIAIREEAEQSLLL